MGQPLCCPLWILPWWIGYLNLLDLHLLEVRSAFSQMARPSSSSCLVSGGRVFMILRLRGSSVGGEMLGGQRKAYLAQDLWSIDDPAVVLVLYTCQKLRAMPQYWRQVSYHNTVRTGQVLIC